MTVIARDAASAAHLVYAWPFPVAAECEVSCGDEEQVVMCPAWQIGDRLGPGRHRWRTPDPSRPSAAYFVLTTSVEVPFLMATSFTMPQTGHRIRIHGGGSVQVRCADAQLLVAQFVGLPLGDLNSGILASVSRSVERMLGRLLTRRVVLAGTPTAVTDPKQHATILEELVAYNPTAGAVFGIELLRIGRLFISADDGRDVAKGSAQTADWGRVGTPGAAGSGAMPARNKGAAHLLETIRGHTVTPSSKGASAGDAMAGAGESGSAIPRAAATASASSGATASGEIGGGGRRATPVPASPPQSSQSLERLSLSSIVTETERAALTAPTEQISAVADPTEGAAAAADKTDGAPPRGKVRSTPAGSAPISPALVAAAAGEIIQVPRGRQTGPAMQAIIVAGADEPTPQPGPPPQPDVGGALLTGAPLPHVSAPAAAVDGRSSQAAGAIIGIGTSAIGAEPAAPIAKGNPSQAVSGEITKKVPPGSRVLVPGPNGLMQSATVRQLLQGYYELEVGSSGQTIWVPIGGVVPES